jgi:undecaprenyl-diphosphatase
VAEFGSLLRVLPGLVEVYGPWVLALLAFLETCFVTGVVVPSGVATAFATALALQGQMTFGAVAVAAVGGGFAGDVTGYWIGRRSGEKLRDGTGFAARALARHDASTGRFLSGHPVFSVTVARLVAFVRTVMPVASGVARMPFNRFLLYEIPGLVAWAALYMGIGYLAGESWERAASMVGGGWAIIFAVAGIVIWLRARRRPDVPDPEANPIHGRTKFTDALEPEGE